LETLFINISGEALRLLRVTAKKKQREIAPIFGVDRTTYVGYEKLEEVKIPIEQAEKLAKLYDMTLDELQQKVGKVPRGDVGIISMPREVWGELKENNQTYREFLTAYRSSFEKLLTTVERSMDNLTKPTNIHQPIPREAKH
jgi:transcriptional regulator with XRE-family HTH domain